MSSAKRSMPKLTDDELLEMAMDDFNAAAEVTEEWYERDGLVLLHMEAEARERDADAEALYEARRVLHPHADPRCKYCHGTGTVYDTVDYGSTTVQMPSTCDCVEEDGDES